jgi:NAD(P)-dependent dehydrogenase (short-subunit alcohol dehydrogenase family)
MKSAEGQRVLITGADSTARVIAETFQEQGARVFACDVRPEAVESLLEANPEMHALVANVGKESDVEKLLGAAQAEFGGIDYLINVVGIAGPTKPTEEVTAEEWQQTLDVNVNGVFYTARGVIPGMKERRHGAIVNFSSASTRTRLPNRAPYVVSKFAVEGLTLNLARELGPHNIRANAILPGGINNERIRIIVKRLADERGMTPEEVLKKSLDYISMRTLIEPQELANMVVFLCSDAARHVTGQLIGVDGNSEWES